MLDLIKTINPAFVIKNLRTELELELDGRKIHHGKQFRYGINYTIESNDLIIWIEYKAIKTTKFTFIPKSGE